MTDSFWTKVPWSRFIKHFRKLTDEQVIKDIHESMDALEDDDASGDSFGAKMVAWANERRNEKAAVASRENGNLGGRPTVKIDLPRNKQEVVEFAIDNGLDTDDASTWAEINLKERKGKDKDGKPIMNWKGALTNYCKAMADKRREPA